MNLPKSKRTENQSFKKVFKWRDDAATFYKMTVTLRYDDRHKNGHNTFAITASLRRNGREDSCGCLHDLIAEKAPEFKKYIKWHLTSSDGPLHYVANTIYLAEQDNLDAARDSAIWPDASLEQLQDKDALIARLPALMHEFKAAMEELGFTY